MAKATAVYFFSKKMNRIQKQILLLWQVLSSFHLFFRQNIFSIELWKPSRKLHRSGWLILRANARELQPGQLCLLPWWTNSPGMALRRNACSSACADLTMLAKATTRCFLVFCIAALRNPKTVTFHCAHISRWGLFLLFAFCSLVCGVVRAVLSPGL